MGTAGNPYNEVGSHEIAAEQTRKHDVFIGNVACAHANNSYYSAFNNVKT